MLVFPLQTIAMASITCTPPPHPSPTPQNVKINFKINFYAVVIYVVETPAFRRPRQEVQKVKASLDSLGDSGSTIRMYE